MIGKILQRMWMVWCLLISTAVVVNTTLAPGQDLYPKINYNIYGVGPHSTIIPLTYTTPVPQKHPTYSVHNIGRLDVLAKTKYGNLLKWTGDISVATVRPNQRATLYSNGLYNRTGLQIRNNRNVRAIVYVTGGNIVLNNQPPPGFDKDRILTKAFKYSAQSIPYVGGGLKALLNTFWPSHRPNRWTQIWTPVNQLLDESSQLYIKNVITQKIYYIKIRIELLLAETMKTNKKHLISVHYMNIAQDLQRLEDYFKFNNRVPNPEWYNTVIIGLFTTTVSMKVNFYEIGIAKPNLFNLSVREVIIVKTHLKNTLHGPKGAITYINNLHTQQVENCYKTCYAGSFYDRMINIRSQIALHGLEAIPFWINAEKNPGSEKQPHVNVISYSEFFGRPTSDLFSVATPVKMIPPLTPDLMAGGARRVLLSIEVFIWRLRGTGPARVAGARLTFEGNRVYTMGTKTSEIQRLNLNGAKITNVRVFGKGRVDELVFSLTDGRVVTLGSANHKNYKDYNLPNHHIVSVCITSDDPSLQGQSANFAVSFRRNDIPRL